MPIRFHVSESTEKENMHRLKVPFYHSYDKLLVEDYTVEVTLPFGATDISVSKTPNPNLALPGRRTFCC
jgi:hypothetical protein